MTIDTIAFRTSINVDISGYIPSPVIDADVTISYYPAGIILAGVERYAFESRWMERVALVMLYFDTTR